MSKEGPGTQGLGSERLTAAGEEANGGGRVLGDEEREDKSEREAEKASEGEIDERGEGAAAADEAGGGGGSTGSCSRAMAL